MDGALDAVAALGVVGVLAALCRLRRLGRLKALGELPRLLDVPSCSCARRSERSVMIRDGVSALRNDGVCDSPRDGEREPRLDKLEALVLRETHPSEPDGDRGIELRMPSGAAGPDRFI